MQRGRGGWRGFHAPRAPPGPGPAWRARPPPLLSESLLLPARQQPPPMFGPRGATLPARLLPRRPPPPRGDLGDAEFWCETCDRGFRSSSQLESHNSQHEKCNIDGCSFVAHPKVITKHIQMQHSTGLYSKISKLNDPEEISKWREERRKKYPTKVNIDKKQAEVNEKIERGEKMCLEKRRFSDNKNQTNNFNDRTRKGPITKRRRPRLQKAENACPENKPIHNLPAFTGINQLLMETDLEEDIINYETNFTIDDEIEEWAEDSGAKCISDSEYNHSVCGALTNLLANYGSSDEEQNTMHDNKASVPLIQKEVVPVIKTTLAQEGNTEKNIEKAESINPKVKSIENSKGNCVPVASVIESSTSNLESTAYDDDESGPEEVKTVKAAEEDANAVPQKAICHQNKNRITPKESGRIMKRNLNPRKLPSTLLEKLLSKEIRHERNLTLQCIRHIVKNNYFQR